MLMQSRSIDIGGGYSITPSNILGKGAFGTVVMGYNSRKKEKVAVKIIPITKLEKNGECTYGNEIETLSEIKGEHIVELQTAVFDDRNLYLVFEYCEGGDLETLLRKKRFSEEEACSIIKQIAQAFVDLEKKGCSLIHRDLKLANILLHKDKIKIADFGFAKPLDYGDWKKKKDYEFCCTPLYASPQVLHSEKYSAKCDIWSAGIILYELLFGYVPWNGFSIDDIYWKIKRNSLRLPKKISPETEDLLARMLSFHEEHRISWHQVYGHPALILSRFQENKENYLQSPRQPFTKVSETRVENLPMPRNPLQNNNKPVFTDNFREFGNIVGPRKVNNPFPQKPFTKS